MAKRLETVGGRNYLFCVGFEVDGGIFRKLESSCLSGIFLFPCKSLRAWEDDTEKEGGCVSGRAFAWYPLGKNDSMSERAIVIAASALDQAFMVSFWYPCLFKLRVFDSLPYWWGKMTFKPMIKDII